MAYMQKIPRAYLRIIRTRVAEAKKEAVSRPGRGRKSKEKKEG